MATATKSNPKTVNATKRITKKTANKSTQSKPSNTVKKANARKATAKKSVPKKSAPKKNAAKKTAPKKETAKNSKHVEGNPYRDGSAYAIAFDCLAKLTKDKPATRNEILEEYCKVSGKDEKRAKYDLAVVLSPSKEGTGHRSSRKDRYWVDKLENSMVQLHMSK